MNTPTFALNVNGKYTIIGIGGMAFTSKIEIVITRFDQAQQRYIFKQKGKRKEYYLNIKADENLIFEGHDLPQKVDSDTNRFCGNACINFVSDDPEKLKAYIREKNINPDFTRYNYVTYVQGDVYTPLFPNETN